jgi:hypothetical protein
MFHSRKRIANSMNARVKLVDVVSGLNETILLTRSLVEKVFGTWSNLPSGPLVCVASVTFYSRLTSLTQI